MTVGDDELLRQRAAANPSTPTKALAMLFEGNGDNMVMAVAKSGRLDPDLIAWRCNWRDSGLSASQCIVLLSREVSLSAERTYMSHPA